MKNSYLYVFCLVLFLCVNSIFHKAFGNSSCLKDTTVTPPFVATAHYNNTYYNSVLEAAKGLAQPYLLQQGFYTLPGVTINGDSLVYNNISYAVNESYSEGSEYYIEDTLYSYLGVDSLKYLWPTHFPNVMYDTVKKKFFSRSDCVGFGCRLLAAVGTTSSPNNAYLNLINRIHAINYSQMASKDYVSTAYDIAVAFPLFRTVITPGWQYIAGNVEDSMINVYNQSKNSSLGTYNGYRKGGFANCEPGDVLAFGYGPNNTSNGHFMIMDVKPVLLDSAGLQHYYPKETGTKVRSFSKNHRVYATSVIDDSGQDAHFFDSRKNYSGIGHGTLLILTDTLDDAPTGFIFSPSTTISYISIKDTNNTYAISVGRYISTQQLPVAISSFIAKENNNNIVINWLTTTELNTSHFIIQHSTDGNSFATIGTVNAIGGGSNAYQFTDIHPTNGSNYYRLESVDKNGASTFSRVVSVQLTVDRLPFTAVPNPARDFVTVKGNHIASVQVIDNIGRVVKVVSLKDASNPVLSVSDLPTGVYHLRVQTTDGKVNGIGMVKE